MRFQLEANRNWAANELISPNYQAARELVDKTTKNAGDNGGIIT